MANDYNSGYHPGTVVTGGTSVWYQPHPWYQNPQQVQIQSNNLVPQFYNDTTHAQQAKQQYNELIQQQIEALAFRAKPPYPEDVYEYEIVIDIDAIEL